MKRIPSLDGIRAFSIAAVIVAHLSNSQAAWPSMLGGVGVNVFFVVSGFLITTLLQQEYKQSGNISLASFYRRRCFRIFPAAFVFILLSALMAPYLRRALPYALTYSVSYFFWSTPPAWRHLWSLSVEEQFYLLWPLAFCFGYRRLSTWAWMAVVAATLWRASVILSPIYGDQYLHLVHYTFFGSMDSLAAGCLLAIYADRLREKIGWLVEVNAVAISLPVVAFILYSALWGDAANRFGRLFPILWPLFCATLALWVFVMVERRDWLLNNWFIVRIGWLSYSLYLWQQIFVFRGIPVALAAGSMLAFAIASYLLVENPMIALGKRMNTSTAPKRIWWQAEQAEVKQQVS